MGLPGFEDLEKHRLYCGRVEAQRECVGTHGRCAGRPTLSATQQQPLVRTAAVDIAINRMPDRLERSEEPTPAYGTRLHGKLAEYGEPRHRRSANVDRSLGLCIATHNLPRDLVQIV